MTFYESVNIQFGFTESIFIWFVLQSRYKLCGSFFHTLHSDYIFLKVWGPCLYLWVLYVQTDLWFVTYSFNMFASFFYVRVLFISPRFMLALFLAAVYCLDGFMSLLRVSSRSSLHLSACSILWSLHIGAHRCYFRRELPCISQRKKTFELFCPSVQQFYTRIQVYF